MLPGRPCIGNSSPITNHVVHMNEQTSTKGFVKSRALVATVAVLTLAWLASAVYYERSASLPRLEARSDTEEVSWVFAVEPTRTQGAETGFAGTLDVSYRAVDYLAGLRKHVGQLDKASECGESQRVEVQDAIGSTTHVDLKFRGVLVITTCRPVSSPKQTCTERWVRLPFGGKTTLGMDCRIEVVTSTEKSVAEHPFTMSVRISAGSSGEVPLSVSVSEPVKGSDDAAGKLVGPLMAAVEASVRAHTTSYFESRPLGAIVPAINEMSNHQMSFKSVEIDRENDLLIEFRLTGPVPEATYRNLQQGTRVGSQS